MIRTEDKLRKCVAFAVPKVLAAISSNDTSLKDAVRHALPSYTLHLYGKDGHRCHASTVSPYFVTDLLKNRGKKRVYLNETGHVITFVRRKWLQRFRDPLLGMLEAYAGRFEDVTSEGLAKQVFDDLADKWIITRGKPDGTSVLYFISSIVGMQLSADKSNAPTQYDSLYIPISHSSNFKLYEMLIGDFGTSIDKRNFERNSMYDLVSLVKYEV